MKLIKHETKEPKIWKLLVPLGACGLELTQNLMQVCTQTHHKPKKGETRLVTQFDFTNNLHLGGQAWR